MKLLNFIVRARIKFYGGGSGGIHCAAPSLHCTARNRSVSHFMISHCHRVVSPISLNYTVHASYQPISVFTEKAMAVHAIHVGPSRNWPVNEILSHNGASRLIQTCVASKTALALIRTVRTPPLCHLEAVCPSALQ